MNKKKEKEKKERLPRLRMSDLEIEIDLDEYVLMKKRTVFLTGDIDFESCNDVAKQIEYLAAISKQPITIVVSNNGGDVYAGLLVHNTMKAVRKAGIKVICEVRGLAASAAVDVICGASWVRAWKYSRILIHEIAEDPGYMKVEEAKDRVKELDVVNKTLNELIVAKSGQSMEKVLNLTKKTDYWMSAQEAKDFGLVDEIIEFKGRRRRG